MLHVETFVRPTTAPVHIPNANEHRTSYGEDSQSCYSVALDRYPVICVVFGGEFIVIHKKLQKHGTNDLVLLSRAYCTHVPATCVAFLDYHRDLHLLTLCINRLALVRRAARSGFGSH